jgi:hypothetical protein
MKLFWSVIFLLSILISCNELEGQSFESELLFITEDPEAIKLNKYSKYYTPFNENIFIYYLDGSCPLCSLDLMEIENIRVSLFESSNITPIVLLYGSVNDYTMHLINEKEIFNYPIYNLSYHSYLNFLRKFELQEVPLIVNKDGIIVYNGDPFIKNNMNRFVDVVSTL